MTKIKIMIAEDDASIVEAMQLILEDANYEVYTTASQHTIPDVQKVLPDLLLLDIRMAGTNSVEMCRELKHHSTTRHIPIIMCSANLDTAQTARECGADDFLNKPFELTELLSKIEQHLKYTI